MHFLQALLGHRSLTHTLPFAQPRPGLAYVPTDHTGVAESLAHSQEHHRVSAVLPIVQPYKLRPVTHVRIVFLCPSIPQDQSLERRGQEPWRRQEQISSPEPGMRCSGATCWQTRACVTLGEELPEPRVPAHIHRHYKLHICSFFFNTLGTHHPAPKEIHGDVFLLMKARP